ncbi:MAG TPA: 5'/3'-nucleotidase SurE [Spirochaetota bacterium]|nr:5'/3'-nucleotidase SurE [Spirochaetota bacterium]HPJ33245.1 5'/3'-nucleotidase SurE [Spirochaetota bacterium]
MKILLTNDDGINAEGLIILERVLSKYHETYIIAPDRERSACSNIFTIRDELILTKISKNRFSINGYPADCVSIAMHSDFIPEIDLVISGINHGPNLGDDVHFSGTVAGARTAFIFGKPGIAFSIDSFHKASPNMPEASEFLAEYIKNTPVSPDTFLNINYPDIPYSETSGIKYTFLSKRYYRDLYIKREIAPNQTAVSLNGEIETEFSEGSDDDAMKRGYISITPLTIDSTDYKKIDELSEKQGYIYSLRGT